MVGGRGHFDAAGLEKLLEATIEQVGDLAAEQNARLGDESCSAAVLGSGQNGSAAVFRDEKTACDARGLSNIKLRTAKLTQDFIKGAGLDLLRHQVSILPEFVMCQWQSYTEDWRPVSLQLSHIGQEAATRKRIMATVINSAAPALGSGILDRIGNTPLIRLERLTAHLPGVQILGKAEWVNPGGSVKDRAASAIVAGAQARGLLTPSKHLLDATSGNTGIAYAMLGSAMGFPVTLCMPSNVSVERKRILHAYGANVVWTDPADGSDGAIRKARELAEDTDKYYYANQYGNDANWRAHYRTTANEIWQQTDGQITHFVAGLGTSGTFVGTTRRLKELKPEVQCISMQPDSPFNGLEGLKHMATAIVPPIYDAALADRNVEMETEIAYITAKKLGRTEGLLVGVSAAAAVATCLRIAEEETAKGNAAVIVTILPDSADKYLSERFWEE
jgi:S-sulfo-L-cysteine synthase (O-acetyl-L-serine-dependent)